MLKVGLGVPREAGVICVTLPQGPAGGPRIVHQHDHYQSMTRIPDPIQGMTRFLEPIQGMTRIHNRNLGEPRVTTSGPSWYQPSLLLHSSL